jgi:hypothetical protein
VTGNCLGLLMVPPLYANSQRRDAARGYFIWREPEPPVREKSRRHRSLELAVADASWTADKIPPDEGTVPRLSTPRESARALRPDRRTDHLAALTPAAAATPSCCPVPPLTPMAPMILPFTVIGTPPSDAIGFSGKVVNAVLPAAY